MKILLKQKILAGDIGGTKTHLALYELSDAKLEKIVQKEYACAEFSSFELLILAFLEERRSLQIDRVCLGVAGPIIDGNCMTTNLPWKIESSALAKLLKTSRVRLLNDLEATAYGMLFLKESEFYELNPHAKKREGNCAVIAAGTGLGEAMLFFDGKAYHPIGCEGGHCDFAPTNSLEDRLLVWMRKRYPQHVSYERILSGAGIYRLYEFLKEEEFAPEPESMLHLSPMDDKNAKVTESALQDKDPLCIEVMRLFAKIYGAETGNLALKNISLGGVYIGGGIAPKILPFLTDGFFFNAFIKKGRFRSLLQDMQLKISLNEQTALLGALHYAVDKF